MAEERTTAAQRRYEQRYGMQYTPTLISSNDSLGRPLRRKGHTIDQYSENTRAYFHGLEQGAQRAALRTPQRSSPYSQYEGTSRDETMFGVAMSGPPMMTGALPRDQTASKQKTLVPELNRWQFPPGDQPRRAGTLPSSTGTPSTFYSESPGPWSSRGTTPNSMSSYSPGITQAIDFSPSKKVASPFKGRALVYNASDDELPLRAPQQEAPPRSQKERYTERPRDLPSNQPPSASTEASSLGKKDKRDKFSDPPNPPPRKSSTKFKSPSKKELATPSSGSPQPRERKIAPPQTISEQPKKDTKVGPTGLPTRPSRQGTTTLDIETSPVVQSELPPGALRGHRKRLSGPNEGPKYLGHMAPTKSSANKAQPPVIPRGMATKSSPALSGPSSDTEGRARTRTREKPTQTVKSQPVTPRSESSEPAARQGKLSRLGLFSRRPKTPGDEQNPPRKPRTLKKGPAAGTGHEGYGKYSQRGRRTSAGSNPSGRDRSASSAARSVSSLKSSNQSGSESELDDFVSQRLEPIVIPGGGGGGGLASHPYLARKAVESNEGFAPRFGTAMGSDGQSTGAPHGDTGEELRGSLSSSIDQPIHGGSPERGRTQSLAVRRSLLRLRTHGESSEPKRLPSPIRTTGYDTTQSLDTLDSAQSPVPRSDSTAPPVSVSSTEGQRKPTGSRWNLFSRNRRGRRTPSLSPERRNLPQHLPVAIADVPDIRPIPHYAMFDSEHETEITKPHPEALGEIFDAIEDSPPEQEDSTDLASTHAGLGLQTRYGESILLPSPHTFMSQFATDSHGQAAEAGMPLETVDIPQQGSISGQYARLNRLAQVGRIPPVISNRNRQHLPPVHSFSRPFAPSRTANEADESAAYTTEEDRPILGVRTDPLPSKLFGEPDSSHPASAPVGSDQNANQQPPLIQPEFLAYPSWYSSVKSSSSSSNAVGGGVAPPGIRPGTMTRQLGEDEVWREYDDLIDDVLIPSEPEYDDALVASPEDNSSLVPIGLGDDLSQHPPEAPVYPIGMSSSELPALRTAMSAESVRLRRSRIVAALHTSAAPSSPSSLADLVAEYEERNRNSTILLNRMSYLFEEAEEGTEKSEGPSQDLHTSINSASNHRRNTILLDVAERYREGPVGLSNLRYGALMISRWLSFSRVLFSPVHNKIATTPNERVLILDGLGNDDWSYYCAETYSTASIHSLNSMVQPSTSSVESTPEAWPAPPNHHAVRLNVGTQTFPFPQSFFAAVVFRFPAAMPESSLRRTLGECYRVLQPGGYIEMSVMDLDMINMGNRTRRAVRMLKVRMNVADAGISLKPASDNIQKILGRRGFQNLNKCIVSIPVAGIVASSSMDSSSSRFSQGSTRQSDSMSSSAKPGTIPERPVRRSTAESSSASERNLLLSDLISDKSPKSDQRITKMVAKVGRWWYTRCYEWAVLPDGDLDRSIWADKKVLQECESRGSGFKLLIAYAQKPLDARRRTLSEPSQPTRAISGGLSRSKLHESA